MAIKEFMVQRIYADDTQDITEYMTREEMVHLFRRVFPFVKKEDFIQAKITIGIETFNIVYLYQ